MNDYWRHRERPMSTIRSRILLITDSLAFPRVEPEIVRYEDTYIALLKSEFPDCDFIHIGRGGGTIVDLYKHTNYFHTTINPALVLMQCGIVDCAPRALAVIEQQIISRLPVLGPFVGRAVKQNTKRLRRWRKMTYTPLPEFAEYVDRFESLYNNIYWIGILPAAAEYESAINGISANIDKYNEILRKRRFVSTNDFTVEDVMTDYHHLNRTGHQKLFRKLASLISTQLSYRDVCCAGK